MHSGLLPAHDQLTPVRIARSTVCREGRVVDRAGFDRWFGDFSRHSYARAERIPLVDLEGWVVDPRTGDIAHRSGGFFSVIGVDVQIPHAVIPHWTQPIINQPEVGLLGILVKEFDGVLHCLIQAKAEPGNPGGRAQLTPTVQATPSNYTGAHGGKAVPYVEYFLDSSGHRVIADVRQSEQASWFHHKRNRNMVVEVSDDPVVLPGFCWLTLGQIHELLAVDDLVNMDVRTVLSCLPFAGEDLAGAYGEVGGDFRATLVRSCSEDAGSRHSMDEILSWISNARSRADVRIATIPLADLTGWRRTEEKISHSTGGFFDVIGVRVTAAGREIGGWTQPMIEPLGLGVVAFLVREIEGVLHALVHARVEPGYVDVAELAPTVQCVPGNYDLLPEAARPVFLDEVLRADAGRVRFSAVLSEQGGRFFQARNRYLVVESDVDAAFDHPDYRWMTMHQLVELLRHSNYLNVQARSLVCCLHALSASAGPSRSDRQGPS